MLRPHRRKWFSALPLVALLLVACASQPLTVTHEPLVLRVLASDSCVALAEELAEAYHQARPWVTVEVEGMNDAVARERLGASAADLGMLSWLEDHTVSLWSLAFATDAVVVVVHPGVPVEGLSAVLLRELFRGSMDQWPDGTPVQVVSREDGAGLRAAFESAVMGGYEVTLTARVVADDASMLEVVASTPGAIGYVSLMQGLATVRPVPIEGMLPTPTALEGYPLSYPLYLAAPGEPEGEPESFVQWVLAPAGQQRVRRFLGPPP